MKIRHIAFSLLCISFISFGSNAEGIYRYVDSNGKVTFSDRAKHDGYIPLVHTWKGWSELKAPKNWKEGLARYNSTIEIAAQKHDLDAELVKAVIHAESHFNPIAVSNKGAVGLMQLMPGTAERYMIANRQDPKQNIAGGTAYLRDLLDMFDNDVVLAVAAYNAGENSVKRRGNVVPPYKETQRYVKKVLGLYKHYSKTNKSQEQIASL
ncbi:MAG: lytic transglycosylase domain-containing protein [Agarilytica sp.]